MFKNFLLKNKYKKLTENPDDSLFQKYFELIASTQLKAQETLEKDKVNEFTKNLNLAISFSPEHLRWLQDQEKFKNKKITNLEFLDFVTKELHTKNVRLGLRWCNIDQNGQLQLGEYEEIIRYCLNNSVQLTLNIGPIKTFRWPEVFVPDYILDDLNLRDHQKLVITSTQEISKRSGTYIENLFELFKEKFGPNFFDKVYAIQPENELFNPFGERLWTLDQSHILELTKVINKYFPNSKILFSGSGDINESDLANPDILKIQNLIRFLSENTTIKNKFIIGLNYYYLAPGFPKNSRGIILDNFSRLKAINGDDIFLNLKKFAEEFDVEIEITELQFEPWGEFTSPGSSEEEFIFQILRLSQELRLLERLNIRLWGAELKFINKI